MRARIGSEIDRLEAAGAFVASPLLRARETMEIARAAMDLPPKLYRVDAALMELTFGDWEGLTWAEVRARDADGVKARRADKWGFRSAGGGESYAMLAERVAAWLAALPGDTFVVAHGGRGARAHDAARRRARAGRRRDADRPGPRARLRQGPLLVDRVRGSAAVAREAPVSAATILLLAASCGLIVANIYYAQPLIGPIAASLGLAPHAAGLIVTMTQIGYAAGLVFLVPLGDLVENRKIVIVCVALSAIAVGSAALASSSAAFLASAFAIGLGSAAVQIIVPLAAHLAPDAIRGRVVGAVMSGLMIGIMASRPVASFIASETSWRVVFVASACLMVALGLVLSRTLPVRKPEARMSYGALIALDGAARRGDADPALARVLPIVPVRRLQPVLDDDAAPARRPRLWHDPTRHRAVRARRRFRRVAAPIAGRLADRGFSRPATGAAILIAALAFFLTMMAPQGSALALALLVAAAVAIDFGVQANVVLGMRAIFALAPEARGRLNGVYIATFFAAGALGSAVGAWAYAEGGWTLASRIGLRCR